jgi:hypothetical protein
MIFLPEDFLKLKPCRRSGAEPVLMHAQPLALPDKEGGATFPMDM